MSPETLQKHFYLAAQQGDLPKVQLLLEEHGNEFTNEKIGGGLWTAAKNGHSTVVKYLIEKHGDKIPDEYKELALFPAAENGHKDIVDFLLNICGNSISPIAKGLALRGAIAFSNNQHIINAILSHAPASSFTPYYIGPSPTALITQENTSPKMSLKRSGG